MTTYLTRNSIYYHIFQLSEAKINYIPLFSYFIHYLFYPYFSYRKFDNVYIGYGLKYSSENYSPPAPPAAQEEFPSGPDITEAEDPTVEQERALAAAQQEALENEDDEDESDEYDENDDD